MKRCNEKEKVRLVHEWKKSGKSKWDLPRSWGLNYQTISKWTRKPVDAQSFVEASGKLRNGTRWNGTWMTGSSRRTTKRANEGYVPL
jgi:transposase-like protein